jgi:two-component system, OmpR family, sensor kinase
MSRLPIRARLALSFATVMALVLAATGLFLYERLAADLSATIDRELDARLAGVVAIVLDDGDDLGDPTDDDPLALVDDAAFVQVLDSSGAIAGTTAPQLARRRVLRQDQIDALARDRRSSVDLFVPPLNESLRLTVARAHDDGEDYTVIVGASLQQRDATLADLRGLLLVGGAVALLLASLAGYGVASGALRPVEHMRRRAAEIAVDEPRGQRLPVPATGDEIARLGATLNAMLERNERAFERERAFTADASHELRTPLAILKTELDLAREGPRSRAALEAALESASEETDRLVRLAENLLVLARADAAQLPIRAEQTDLGELVRRVAERFATQASTIQVSVPDAAVHALVDPLRVEQALSNMIDNALRYGGGGQIVVRLDQLDDHLELHVLDAGDGFPETIEASAFDRFVRADHGDVRGGTGLGLSIVAAIARSHDGSAHARNRPGGGADVFIALPCSKERAGALIVP